MNIYRNSEGYSDPTAGEALSNIFKEERNARRKADKKRKAANRNNALSKKVEEKESGRDGSISGPGKCGGGSGCERLSKNSSVAQEKSP